MIADKEEIDIRSYSIIYDAINDIKDAMEGMLSPEMREEITGTAEIRETFKISKIGTIAGCMVTDGKIYRNSGIRIIREGVVIHSGSLISLKRFKDDAKEVAKGYDCGLQVKSFNDIQIADVVECFQEVAVKKTLESVFFFTRNAEGKICFSVSNVFNPFILFFNLPAWTL